jgi:trk system potassium uptake protein
VILSVTELLLLWTGGMSLYEAALLTMTTGATGGFSPRGRSSGAYDSIYIESVIIVFMLLPGMNFSLHFFVLWSRLHVYWRDPEWRFYLGVVVISIAVVMVILLLYATYFPGQAFRYALF